MVTLALGGIGLEFLGRKITAQSDVVEDAQRFVDALGPLWQDFLDDRPGSNGLHEDALAFVK